MGLKGMSSKKVSGIDSTDIKSRNLNNLIKYRYKKVPPSICALLPLCINTVKKLSSDPFDVAEKNRRCLVFKRGHCWLPAATRSHEMLRCCASSTHSTAAKKSKWSVFYPGGPIPHRHGFLSSRFSWQPQQMTCH